MFEIRRSGCRKGPGPVSIPAILSVAAVLLISPVTADARNLEQELRSLLSDYPALDASKAEIEARGQDIRAIAANKQPQVTGTAEGGLERTDNPSNEQFRSQIGVTATYNLFDGDATHYQLQASRTTEEQGRSDLASVRNRVIIDGVAAYLNIVLQEKLVRLAERHVAIITDITQFIARERDNGRMTLADSLQSRARLQQAKEARIAFDGGRMVATARYRKLFRNQPDVRTMEDPVAPFASMPASADDAVRIALERNPSLDSARQSVDIINAQRLAAGSTRMPRLDLEGTADGKNDYDGTDGSETEGSVVLKVSWALFDGDRSRATQMAAAHRQSAALATLRQLEIDTEEAVRQTWHRVDTAAQRLETLVAAENIALEAYNARYQLMTGGQETIINVLDTALEVLNVRTALIRADYQHRLAAYRLLGATGQLTADSLSQILAVEPLRLEAIDSLPANLGGTQLAIPGQPETASQLQAASQIDQFLLQPQTAPTPSPSSTLPDDIMSLVPDNPSPAASGTALQAADRVAPPVAVLPSGEGFYVVLSANRVAANAAKDVQRFTIPGVEVKTFTVGGKPMHMVVVGPLPEPEARVVQGEALGLGVLDAWLKKG